MYTDTEILDFIFDKLGLISVFTDYKNVTKTRVYSVGCGCCSNEWEITNNVTPREALISVMEQEKHT